MGGFTDFLGNIIGPILGYVGERERTKDDGKERPLTQNEKWLTDEQQKLYGNSATRNYIGNGMHQIIGGINAPGGPMAASPTFRSSYMSGQSIPQGPRIDMSQMPAPAFRLGPNANGPGGRPSPGGPGPMVPPGNGPTPGTNPGVGGSGGQAPGLGGDGINRGAGGGNKPPLNQIEPPIELPGGGRLDESFGDFLNRNPGGDPRASLPGGGAGTQGPPPGMSYGEADLKGMWDKISPLLGTVGMAGLVYATGLSEDQIRAALGWGRQNQPQGPGGIPGSISGGAGDWGKP